jgi:hypothetical protein
MNVRIGSRSVQIAVLRLFFLAAFTRSLSLEAFAQSQPHDESASFKNVKETVSRLLSEPVYKAADEKLLNSSGDAAALPVTGIVSKQEMNSPETGRRILLILHLAFEAPQSIIDRKNKTPTAALWSSQFQGTKRKTNHPNFKALSRPWHLRLDFCR